MPHVSVQVVHSVAGWSAGWSYGCHPAYGDAVAALNAGLREFKRSPEYRELCERYPSVACDCLAVDCEVAAWSAWVAWGTGKQRRTRSVITPASSGGSPCPVLEVWQANGRAGQGFASTLLIRLVEGALLFLTPTKRRSLGADQP